MPEEFNGRGFSTATSTLSEHLALEKLVAGFNACLAPKTRAVLAQGGLLDKYIGDAVVGVLIAREDHGAQALTCVLAMQRICRARYPKKIHLS